jgi:hypothetical protein
MSLSLQIAAWMAMRNAYSLSASFDAGDQSRFALRAKRFT